MGKFFLPIALLTAQAQTDVPLEAVDKTAGLIEKYGLEGVMCAILLVITMVLFGSTIRRSNRDETIVKLLVDLTNTINNIKNNDVDVAGSFDKHNTKFVLEVDRIKTAINSISTKLDAIEQNEIGDIRKIVTALDQECSDIRDSIDIINRDMRELKGGLDDIEDLKKKATEVLHQVDIVKCKL